MARRETVPGWTRLGQNEFKAAIMAAARTEPDLRRRLQWAIAKTASCRGVRQGLRDRYLRWITEVEAAISVMAEAEHPIGERSPSILSANAVEDSL